MRLLEKWTRVLSQFEMTFSKLLPLAILLGLCGCGSEATKGNPDYYTTIGQGLVTIYVNNQSSFSQDRLNVIVSAINNQLSKDLKPTWGIDAQLLLGTGQKQLTIVEDFAVSFPRAYGLATGFHSTGSQGFVGLKDCENEAVFSITISHEVLEMLANPNVQRNGNELCDPCGSRTASYFHEEFTGVYLSDFVLPNFYIPNSSGPYDYTGKITAPLTPMAGHRIFDSIAMRKKHEKSKK